MVQGQRQEGSLENHYVLPLPGRDLHSFTVLVESGNKNQKHIHRLSCLLQQRCYVECKCCQNKPIPINSRYCLMSLSFDTNFGFILPPLPPLSRQGRGMLNLRSLPCRQGRGFWVTPQSTRALPNPPPSTGGGRGRGIPS